MRNELAALWQRRELLWILVRRDLKVRYKNSRLGFLWSVAPPLMQVVVITFVFTRATNLAKDFPSYSAFLIVAMIPWTYFSSAILDSSQSILLMYGVIKKTNIPREIIPLANAISNFIHFLLSWGVFFVYWWGFRQERFLPTAGVFPILILIQFMLVTGLSLFVSCLNVFYEDVKYIVTIFMGLGLFAFPILMLVEQIKFTGSIGKWWHEPAVMLYLYNPMSVLITGYRKALLEAPGPNVLNGNPYPPLDYNALVLAAIVSLGVLVAGYAYFNARKWQFVERP